MPSNIVKSFAEKSGKSKDEVEKLWNKAKSIVSKEYPNVEKESDKWYALVTGTLKNMVGLKESSLLNRIQHEGIMEHNESTFIELVEEEISDLEKLAEECSKKHMKEEEGDKKDMETSDDDEEVEDEEGDGKKKKKKKKDMEDDDSDEEVEDSDEEK